MKIKLKNPQALPNAWKSCGMTKDEWKDLESGSIRSTVNKRQYRCCGINI